MAVNLKAVATLDTRPYTKGLSELAAGTSKLSKASVKGAKDVVDAKDQEIAAHERNAKAMLNGARTAEAVGTKTKRAMRQATVSAEEYGKALGEVQRHSGKVVEAYSQMTPAVARHTAATEKLGRARAELARQVASGLEGPALTRYQDQVDAASRAVGKARASVIAADTKAREAAEEASRKLERAEQARIDKANAAAETERMQQKHMRNGIAEAAAYRASISGLSEAKLKLGSASEKLAAAEGAYANALGRSAGAITPAVQRTRAQLQNAQVAYNQVVEAQAAVGKGGPAAASGLAAQRYLLHDLSRQAAMASVAMAALPVAAIATAAAWERSFADVKRTGDPVFMSTTSRADALRDSLVGMAQAMPTSFGDITEIATLANQMGIASTQTSEFTRAVAMFTATSGVSVDMAASAFGRLTSILGDSSIGFMEMSDSILKVGVNSVATEDEIINITTQVSSIAAQAGFSAKEMIALSGALASVRVPPELSRGVVSRVFGQIDKAVASGGTNLNTLARLSGVTAEQFRNDWGTERGATLFNGFLHGLRDAGASARSELTSLGITSVRDQPVMLRLANAADSEGNVGELFTQTLNDANRAAGETQRQYTIMADTVVGKLKILGNNVLAFFDAAGQSGLGVFGGLLDKATKGVRDLTRSLDDPNAIFGVFGQTNADIIGWTISIGLAASAVALLGSAYLKVRSGIVAAQHGLSLIGMGGGKAGGGMGIMPVGGFGAMTKGAGAATRSLGGLATAGRGVLSVFGGLPGIAITAGVAALSMINSKAKDGATDFNALAESMSSIDLTNLNAVNHELSKLTVAGPDKVGGFEMNTTPFKNGVADFRDALKELNKTRESNTYDWFGTKQTFEPGQWIDRSFKGQWDDLAGLKTMDESIQQMVDSGNAVKAGQMIRALAKDGEHLSKWMNMDEGKNVKAYMDNAFELAGIENTEANIDKFVNGKLPELTDALAGVKGATLSADQLFDGDIEQLGLFAKAVDEGAASFLNLGASMEAATTMGTDGKFESFDLSKWSEVLAAQVKAKENWETNLSDLTKFTNSDVIASLAGMGEAGQHAVQALAEGLRNGEPVAIESLKVLEGSIGSQVGSLGNVIAEQAANTDWFKGLLKNDELAASLLGKFSPSDLAAVREAGQNVGEEALHGIVGALANGDISIDEAIKRLELSSPLVNISPTFEGEAVERGMAALQRRLETNSGVKIDTEITTETTVADLRKLIDNPELNKMDIDANLTLAEAYAQSRAFQVWAASEKIDMFLGADTTAADFSLATLIGLANGTIATVTIDALGAPAEGKIWQVVQTADGANAYVEIDANTGQAEGKIGYVIDQAGNKVEIPLTASDVEAINAVNNVGDHATQTPANISVRAIDYASAVIDAAARPRETTITVRTIGGIGNAPADQKWWAKQANGGVMEFYANGGVRENHVAQIAPAGTNRVWAEEETGGEAYIPLAQSKRVRSEAILADVADRFGYALQPQNYTKYADGGLYMAQAMTRQRFTPAATRNGSDAKINIGEVSFTQANQKDQFREFKRAVGRAVRGL